MKQNIKSSVVLFVLTAFVALAAGMGCKHTAHGVGEDVENVGEKIQDKTN